MAISFEDVDYSAGAQTPPPQAVMVTGTGANSDGILANFTFLTNTSRYCIGQWTYTPPDRPTEPFQWVALQEPGHVTGMICEGAAGSRYYTLVDSEQRATGPGRSSPGSSSTTSPPPRSPSNPNKSCPDSPTSPASTATSSGCDHPVRQLIQSLI